MAIRSAAACSSAPRSCRVFFLDAGVAGQLSIDYVGLPFDPLSWEARPLQFFDLSKTRWKGVCWQRRTMSTEYLFEMFKMPSIE